MLSFLYFFICLTPCQSAHPNTVESSSLLLLKLSNTSYDTIPKKQNKAPSKQQPIIFPDTIDWSNLYKTQVSLKDSFLWVRGNIRKDYRIIGYERPSINSKQLILFSVFTRDVQDNPHNYPFGAYYSTSDMAFEDTRFKFKGFYGNFVRTDLISEGVLLATFYFEKKWVQFTKY